VHGPKTAGVGRRVFLGGALGSLLVGPACSSDGAAPLLDGGSADVAPVDPDLVAVHAFVNEGTLDKTGKGLAKTGTGLDARKRIDLSTLGSESLDVGAEAFFVRTERPDLLPQGEPRELRLGGLVEREIVIPTSEIVALSRPMGVHLLECSGNTKDGAFGLISATTWDGVPLSEVLGRITPKSTLPEARVLVTGFDDHSQRSEGGRSIPGASWVFARADLSKAGAFLATGMGGKPLLPDHGSPIRLMVPNFFGCACIKWIERIDLVADDAPATDHMKEFAARTHQHVAFDLARQYSAPVVEAAALCIRAEHRRVGGKVRLFLRGIVWGGTKPTELMRLFLDEAPGDPLFVKTPASSATTWGIWEYTGPALAPGLHSVRLGIEPIGTPQRRLDLGWYTRIFEVRA
jgi:DMSO/TMAO reductase YedYZ molybdopterin-dependent catalytic subunit